MTNSCTHSCIVPIAGERARKIDGKIAGAALIARCREQVGALIGQGLTPGLAVVLVGEDPASAVYVKSKSRLAKDLGLNSQQFDLPANVEISALLDLIDALNSDPRVHGILVQLPLPKGLDSARVLERIDPRKDVDGIHPVNAGLLASGLTQHALIACTPLGSLQLIKEAARALGRTLAGAEAVIIGRSNLMGKPMAQLLLAENATVTVAHSRTKNLDEISRRADILVAAVGQPEMVRGDWIKDGAIVIDVGVNRVPVAGGGYRLTGDVAYAECLARAAGITPVPGGVGQMTVPMLMSNTIEAARRSFAG